MTPMDSVPRWTQVCDACGLTDQVRADRRPVRCPNCQSVFPVRDDSRVGAKRASGSAALSVLGDGRPRNRSRA